MAAFDKFVIKVKGKGVHGSAPEKGIDPVNIAAHIVLALQAITTRELNATKPLVLTIGKIQGGSQYNIIPDEVVIEGTIRTLEEEVRQVLPASVLCPPGGKSEASAGTGQQYDFLLCDAASG